MDFASLVSRMNEKSLRRQGTVGFLEIVSVLVLVDTYDNQMRVVVGLSQ